MREQQAQAAQSGPIPEHRRRSVPSQRRSGAWQDPPTDEVSTQGRHRDAGSTPEAVVRRPGVVAVALALMGPPVLGMVADRSVGSGPGLGLAVGATVGALVASLLAARRRALWWVAPLPVLVVAAVTAVSRLVSGSGRSTSLTQAVRSAVAAFPAMAGAECAVLVVAVVMAVLRSNGRRGSGA